jgi:hypothetical protein
MAQEMDTNANEAFKQTCNWFSPKNKVFAGSGSLHNRLAIAAGINSLGYNEFFTRLLNKLGITMNDNVAHYLRLKENNRVKRIAKTKTKDAKLAKNSHKRAKLVADTRIAKTQFHKLQGTYKKGMNIDDPYGEQAAKDKEARKPAARPRNTGAAAARGRFCPYCGKRGHATTKQKKCTADANATKKYRQDDGNLLVPVAATGDNDDDDNFIMPPVILDDDHAVDCDANNLLPFDHEVQQDDDSDLDLLHDSMQSFSDDDYNDNKDAVQEDPQRSGPI